jgi:DNA invertase Pin-like site-specific DNA recombinase
MAGQFVAYYRVSTDRQGRSGLGLQAQQAAVRGYLGPAVPIAEFTEVETGKRNDRPELKQALALCRKRKARLVIAKLSDMKNAGMSARQMASQLSARNIPTLTGGQWHAQTVIRMLDRAGIPRMRSD